MSNRPILIIVILAALFIGIAGIASWLHPGGDLPPADKQAEEDQQKMEEAQKEALARKKESDARQSKMDRGADAFDKFKEGAVHVTLEIEGRGTMVMELYPLAAPKTVAHITDLVKQKFFDGIRVHRADTSPAVLQMGDPLSKTTDPSEFKAKNIGSNRGSATTVPLEAVLPHAQYSVGLARSASPDSGDSQFYINTEANPALDGNYCVFGRIIQGMDVVSKIEFGDRIKSMVMN